MGPKGCPEKSVASRESTLRNISEERRFHLRRGRKSDITQSQNTQAITVYCAKYGHTVWGKCRVLVWSKSVNFTRVRHRSIPPPPDGCKGSNCCAFTRLDGIWGTESTKVMKYLNMHNSKKKHFLENENLCFCCGTTADCF
jgi:hypothetical protein